MGTWSSEALVIGKGQEDATPQVEASQQEAMRCNLDVGRFSPAVQARESFAFTHRRDQLPDMHPWLGQYVVVLCILCCNYQWFHGG